MALYNPTTVSKQRGPEEKRAAQQARVLALLRRYGWNATSFQVLEPGLRYWFGGDDTCVAYVDTGKSFVVAGAPIAGEAQVQQAAERFAAFARRCGRRLRFFAVADRFLELAPFDALQVGEQPCWDPAAWPQILKGSRSLREQLRRARAHGVAVRLLDAQELEGPARAGVEALIARWLGSRRMAPMGFLVEVHPFSFAGERRYFVAEREGRVVGFLAAVPIYARGGWFFEDLLRDPEAPNGTAELLVDAAMRDVAAGGAGYVTLGLAPLAGVSGWLASMGRLTRGLYDFSGLAAFKAKLRPQAWEAIFLAYPRGELGVVALSDTLSAFSRRGLLRFGLETLARVPNVVIQALALLLVPWTVALAFAPAREFPAPWVQAAWVAFDVVLFALLMALVRRWNHALATALASIVTADAAITLAQALAWNLPRARGAADVLVACVAVLAPSVAALLLWRARWHRRRWLQR